MMWSYTRTHYAGLRLNNGGLRRRSCTLALKFCLMTGGGCEGTSLVAVVLEGSLLSAVFVSLAVVLTFSFIT